MLAGAISSRTSRYSTNASSASNATFTSMVDPVPARLVPRAPGRVYPAAEQACRVGDERFLPQGA